MASLLALRLLFPDRGDRAEITYLFVLTLGYGHLIGPLVLGRRSARRWRPAGVPVWLGGAFAGGAIATGFAAYALALAEWPALVLPMLGLATWHAFENDVALGDAYARGMRMGPVPRAASRHVQGAGLSLLVVALFAAAAPPAGEPARAASASGGLDFGTLGLLARAGAASAGLWLLLRPGLRPGGAALAAGALLVPRDLTPWVTFADMFGVWTLYHVYSWLILSRQRLREVRRRSPAEARRRGAALLGVHAAPASLSAMLVLGALPADGWPVALVFSPGAYLFWSVAHAVQTVRLRGLEPARAAPVRSVRGPA